MNNPIEIYQTADGQTQVEVRFEQETVWLSQAQMVVLFGRDQSVISRHIRQAVHEGEISEKSNMQKMHIANSDKPVIFYSLNKLPKIMKFEISFESGRNDLTKNNYERIRNALNY